MNTPFIYGALATGANFTDREEETKHLVTNFKSLINTIIISPRRWGKSSLVHKAAELAVNDEKKLKVCHIDLFNVRNETHFYELFAEKVIAATSTKWDEVISTAKRFMGSIMPRIGISDGVNAGMTFDFIFDKKDFNADQILDLPETLAREKKIRLVVCLDEFQNIGDLKDGEYIFKRLRSHWQLHQNVGYCLYGSKKHMMMEIFSSPAKPFYKFGDLMFLQKIPREYWVPFISGRFKETGKNISEENASLIAELVEDHPYYCQQLAQISWLRTEKDCSREIIEQSHITLREQLALLFENMTSELTEQQIAFMQATINEEEALTSTAVMEKYGISSSTSVIRSKKALINKDILDVIGGKVNFQDPIYKFWLKSKYFNS